MISGKTTKLPTLRISITDYSVCALPFQGTLDPSALYASAQSWRESADSLEAWIREFPERPRRVEFLLGLTLCHGWTIPPQKQYLDNARQTALAWNLFAAAYSPEEACGLRLWLSPTRFSRTTVAIAAPETLLQSLENWASRNGLGLLGIKPFWTVAWDRCQSGKLPPVLVHTEGSRCLIIRQQEGEILMLSLQPAARMSALNQQYGPDGLANLLDLGGSESMTPAPSSAVSPDACRLLALCAAQEP